MSVRLLLETGNIKNYRTWYLRGGGDYDCTTYHTECGMYFEEAPLSNAGCEHLDCAMSVAEYNANDSRLGVYLLPFIVIFIVMFFPDEAGLYIGGMYLLFWIYAVFSNYMDNRKTRELKEFKDHGTINGVKAKQI